jgi:hypothetical protein
MAQHGMRMAKASKQDIKALHDYLLKAQQKLNSSIGAKYIK